MALQMTQNSLFLIEDDSSSDSELSSAQFDSTSTRRHASDDRLPPNEDLKRTRGIAHHKTWAHARDRRPTEPERDRHGHKYWYCSRCNHKGVTSLKRARSHLYFRHHIRIVEELGPIKQATKHTIEGIFGQQISRQLGQDSEQEKHLQKAINQSAFQEALIQFISVNNLPHRIVESPELRALLLSLNWTASDVLVESHSSVPKLLYTAFMSHKRIVKQKLHGALSKIHFSIDMWSAPSKTGYQAIVAHFVDETWKPVKTLLALREHKGSHGGEAQAEVFLEVVREYNIQDRIGYFTTDNALSNDNMLRQIAKQVPGFDPIKQRLRCQGHVINLAVQAFLFAKDQEATDEAVRQLSQLAKDELKGSRSRIDTAKEWRQLGPLGRAHNTVNHMRSSTQHYQNFKARAGRSIPKDNSTRWNSWYQLLHVLLKKRVEVNNYQDAYYSDLTEDVLTRSDWEELQEYHGFLKPFYDITQDGQFDSQTLDEALSSMDFLISHLNSAKEAYKDNPTLMSRIMTCWYKFDEYYTLIDKSPVYATAVLLHPALRKAYFDEHWKGKPRWIKQAVEGARLLWQREYRPASKPTEQLDLSPYQVWKNKVYKLVIVEDEFESFVKASNFTFFLFIHQPCNRHVL